MVETFTEQNLSVRNNKLAPETLQTFYLRLREFDLQGKKMMSLISYLKIVSQAAL